MTKGQILRKAFDCKRRCDNILEMWQKKARQAHQVTCKKGCDHCCYQLIHATLYEGVVIANRLINRQDSSRIDKVVAQGENQAQIVHDANTKEEVAIRDTDAARWFVRQEACCFLENNLCTIYDIRPIACTSYMTVTPPELCAGPGTTHVGVVNNHLPLIHSMHFDAEFYNFVVNDRPDRNAIVVPLPLGMAVTCAMNLLLTGPEALKESLEVNELNLTDNPQTEDTQHG